MKITFNPVIRKQQANFNSSKTNVLRNQKQVALNGLDCLANYNLSFGTRKLKAVYAIDYDGSYEKFEKAKDAVKKYGSSVRQILTGYCSTTNGKRFIYADEIETLDGEITSNAIFKVLAGFQDAQNQAIYAIDYFGNIQRFDNRTILGETLHISKGEINRILNQHQDTASGYTFVSAFDVELRDKNGKLLKDENNNPVVDIEIINRLRERFLYTGKEFPVARIDIDGNVERFLNINEAAQKTNSKRVNIDQSILKQSITQERYTYVRLSDVVMLDQFEDVVFDENNDFAIDYNEVELHRKKVFKKKMSRISKG